MISDDSSIWIPIKNEIENLMIGERVNVPL